MNENAWRIRRGGQTYPAPDVKTICAWAEDGKIARTDEIWSPETRQWLPVLDFPEVAAILNKPRNCPVDQSPLIAATVEDVTLDRCPTCGGVWLDPGELDLIRARIRDAASEDAFSYALMTEMLFSR